MAPAKESQVDILIIGAGAAGTMAAACCAAYGLRNVRVIDKRPAKISAGHADGFNARTMEVLKSFGLYERLRKETAEIRGPFFWNADADGGKRLEMFPVVKYDRHSLSFYYTCTLSQAKMQDIVWTEYIEPKIGLQVDRSTITEKLEVKTEELYPVHLTIRKTNVDQDKHVSNPNGLLNNEIRLDDDAAIIERSQQTKNEQELIKAKYVIACDGAHSWTRRQLDIPMRGDDTDMVWGVMDIKPTTDFPAARLIGYIISKEQHSGLLWIPRERGLIRIYCALAEFSKDNSSAEEIASFRSSVTEKSIFENIKKNMRQFNITYEYCEWWAAYQIGQRVATDNIDPSGRIFLAGDAVHTHSPKAGQGMNVSMIDCHSLVWKLNLVLKGIAKSEILGTYRDERLTVGQRLVAFDRAMAAMASGREPPELPEGVAGAEDMIKSGQSAAMVFIQGLDVTHSPNILMMSTKEGISEARKAISEGRLPEGIVTGLRFPLFDVGLHSDTSLINFDDLLTTEGCLFRIILFVGDLTKSDKVARLHKVAQNIENLRVPRELFEVLTVHTADPLHLLNWIEDLPDICHPLDKHTGYDYNKLLFDHDLVDHRGFNIPSTYKKYNVDPEEGRLVIVRPDGFVAYQGKLEDFEPVKKYFQGFLVSAAATNGQTVANGVNV